jgi:hypothetical protein
MPEQSDYYIHVAPPKFVSRKKHIIQSYLRWSDWFQIQSSVSSTQLSCSLHYIHHSVFLSCFCDGVCYFFVL